MITNFEDHFTFIYQIDSGVILNVFKEAASLLHLLEKQVVKFSFQKEFGFITASTEHSGSAIEIAYSLKLHKEIADSIHNNLPE